MLTTTTTTTAASNNNNNNNHIVIIFVVWTGSLSLGLFLFSDDTANNCQYSVFDHPVAFHPVHRATILVMGGSRLGT